MIPYILHVALLITVCLCFYMLLLRRETFYMLNRFVLLSILVLSFVIPLISVPQQWAFGRKQEVNINTPLPENNIVTADHSKPVIPDQKELQLQENKTNDVPKADSANAITWASVLPWIFYLYWTGVIVFALNFLLQLIVLLSRAWRKPVIKDGRFKIVELSGDKAPCSFSNYISSTRQNMIGILTTKFCYMKKHISGRDTLLILCLQSCLSYFNGLIRLHGFTERNLKTILNF